jgi:hypothetical protein
MWDPHLDMRGEPHARGIQVKYNFQRINFGPEQRWEQCRLYRNPINHSEPILQHVNRSSYSHGESCDMTALLKSRSCENSNSDFKIDWRIWRNKTDDSETISVCRIAVWFQTRFWCHKNLYGTKETLLKLIQVMQGSTGYQSEVYMNASRQLIEMWHL